MQKPYRKHARRMEQRGVVLFFALIALLALSLSAVALIRSVDTSTMIAGNLAFRQASSTSADAGVESAIRWLDGTGVANGGMDAVVNPAHPLNQDAPTLGYYSAVNNAVDLTDGTSLLWDDSDSMFVGTDATGNKIRYVIHRICRTPNQPIKDADCLFSSAKQNTNGRNILLPQDVCVGAGCPADGQAPQLRITVRTEGLRNSISYVQTFVF
jgi:Tfp pilus assembly protein PilX